MLSGRDKEGRTEPGLKERGESPRSQQGEILRKATDPEDATEEEAEASHTSPERMDSGKGRMGHRTHKSAEKSAVAPDLWQGTHRSRSLSVCGSETTPPSTASHLPWGRNHTSGFR